MHLSFFARSSALALSLSLFATQALAADMPYTDVPAETWYRVSLQGFFDKGRLDTTKTTFRPAATATRAEFVKLALNKAGIKIGAPPYLSSFDDVKKSAWYFPVLEEAAKQEWVKGDANCYGRHPCRVHPEAAITRGEAAALLVRAFGIERTGESPRFIDVGEPDWFAYAIQAAADHCVLRGDDATTRVRPHDPVNRAEMIVMLDRVDDQLTYAKDCPGKKPAVTEEPAALEETESVATASSSKAAAAAVETSLYASLRPLQVPSAIRRGTRNTPVFAVEFSASCGSDEHIESLLVHHRGTGHVLDVTGLYAAIDDSIVADGQYRWQDRGWTFSFAPPLLVRACQQTMVSFRVDIPQQAQPNADHGFALEQKTSVRGPSSRIAGIFPIAGPKFIVK